MATCILNGLDRSFIFILDYGHGLSSFRDVVAEARLRVPAQFPQDHWLFSDGEPGDFAVSDRELRNKFEVYENFSVGCFLDA